MGEAAGVDRVVGEGEWMREWSNGASINYNWSKRLLGIEHYTKDSAGNESISVFTLKLSDELRRRLIAELSREDA